MMRLKLGAVALVCSVALVACSSDDDDNPRPHASGGSAGTAGATSSGGSGNTAGATDTGGGAGVGNTSSGGVGNTAGATDLGGTAGAGNTSTGGVGNTAGAEQGGTPQGGAAGAEQGGTTPEGGVAGAVPQAGTAGAVQGGAAGAEQGGSAGTVQQGGAAGAEQGGAGGAPGLPGLDEACDAANDPACAGLLTCVSEVCTIVPAEAGEQCDEQVTCAAGQSLTCFEGICVHTGAITISLSWTDSSADLDLSVTTPAGNTISISNEEADGGTFDVDDCSYDSKHDAYECTDPAGTHVESVYFAADPAPTSGDYSVLVENYRSESAEAVPYTVTVTIGDTPTEQNGSLASEASADPITVHY